MSKTPQITVRDEEARISIIHKFTNTELAKKNSALVEALTEQEAVEDEKSEAMSGFKARLDSAKKKVNTIKTECQRGEEVQFVDTILTRNFKMDRREYRLIVEGSLKPGKIVKKEALTQADRQLEMDLIQGANEQSEDDSPDAPDDTPDDTPVE